MSSTDTMTTTESLATIDGHDSENSHQNQNYEEMSRETLIQFLHNRDESLRQLNTRFDHQLTDVMLRYTDLRKSYEEQSLALLNTLWVHCAVYHPDLKSIPPIEFENAIVENDKHIGNFIFGEFLGEGTFATVKSCRQFNHAFETDLIYTSTFDLAAKIIDKNKIKNFMTLKRLSDEIAVLKRLNNPSIIGFKDVIHTPTHLYIITERGGIDMFDFLHRQSGAVEEDLARNIIVGILQAVSYIHDQGICHRDLKPENILLSFPHGYSPAAKGAKDGPTFIDYPTGPTVLVKICDFGVSSKFYRKIMLQDFCGSPGFFAPEMLLQGYYFGDKADLWSIGCILLELALGHRRFCLYWMRAYSYDVLQDLETFSNRITKCVESVLSADMLRQDSEYEDFLKLFLQLSASQRPPFKKISQHNWLRDLFRYTSTQDSNNPSPDNEDRFIDVPPSHHQSINIARYNTMNPGTIQTMESISVQGGSRSNSRCASPTNMRGPIASPTANLDPIGFNNDLMSHLFNHLNELSAEYPRVPVDLNEENDYFRLPSKATWNLFPNENSRSKEDLKTWVRNGYQQAVRNEPPPEANKVRVLLVEDSAAQRKLMKRRIESVGQIKGSPHGRWEVVQCPDGETALTIVDESKELFDVIVVDQNLATDPNRMEGHEVVNYCRARFPDAVIIGATSNAPKHAKSLLFAGADLVWAKPLPCEEVIFANVSSMMRIRRPQLLPDQVLRSRLSNQQLKKNSSVSYNGSQPSTGPQQTQLGSGGNTSPVHQPIIFEPLSGHPEQEPEMDTRSNAHQMSESG